MSFSKRQLEELDSCANSSDSTTSKHIFVAVDNSKNQTCSPSSSKSKQFPTQSSLQSNKFARKLSNSPKRMHMDNLITQDALCNDMMQSSSESMDCDSKIAPHIHHQTASRDDSSPSQPSANSATDDIVDEDSQVEASDDMDMANSFTNLPSPYGYQQPCEKMRELDEFGGPHPTPGPHMDGEMDVDMEVDNSKSFEDEFDACAGLEEHERIYSLSNFSEAVIDRFDSVPESERGRTIHHLLQHCNESDLKYIHDVLTGYFTRDFISSLPREIAIHILSFLSPSDLGVCSRVSSSWRVVLEDNQLWEKICHTQGVKKNLYEGVECALSPMGEAYRRRKKHEKLSPSRSREEVLHRSGWKMTAQYRSLVEQRWLNGKDILPKVVYSHGRNFITSMAIANGRVLTGSEDTTVRVVNLCDANEVSCGEKEPLEMRHHNNGVWALAAEGNIFVSGGTDRRISVVDLSKRELIFELRGHTSTVRCLALKNGICVSGSRDHTLRVWDVMSSVCLHVLEGHDASVRCVCFDGKTVVSGSYDAKVRVWDADTGRERFTLAGHTGRIYCLEFDGKRIASGCLNSLVFVWDATTGQVLHNLIGHTSLISALKLRGDLLISGGADSLVRVWNLANREKDLLPHNGVGRHASAITAIHIGSFFFVTSSDDGHVKLWDLRTGNFIRNLMRFEDAADMGVVWRIVATEEKLICACGHRNRQTDSKVLMLDFNDIKCDGLPSPVVNKRDNSSDCVKSNAGVSKADAIKTEPIAIEPCVKAESSQSVAVE